MCINSPPDPLNSSACRAVLMILQATTIEITLADAIIRAQRVTLMRDETFQVCILPRLSLKEPIPDMACPINFFVCRHNTRSAKQRRQLQQNIDIEKKTYDARHEVPVTRSFQTKSHESPQSALTSGSSEFWTDLVHLTYCMDIV